MAGLVADLIHIADGREAVADERVPQSVPQPFDTCVGGELKVLIAQVLVAANGAVFLVDRHTGDVIWSTSEMPKSSDAADLKRSADHIAARLADARHKKK